MIETEQQRRWWFATHPEFSSSRGGQKSKHCGDEDEDSSLGDFIEDEKGITPAQAAALRLLGDQIKEIIIDLQPREQKILKMRFGLDDGVTHTLEEVGNEFGITRERIRQIEFKALEKIRQHHNLKKLEGY